MTNKNSTNVKSLVIIPTYNERENAPEVVRLVLDLSEDIEVLVVDDNSPDGTGDLVEKLAKQQPRLHVIHRAGKLGLGTAYIEGFKYALANNYEYIFEMDADFSHDPNEIPNFLKAIKEADLVIGSRYIVGVNVVNWPLSRLLLSICASIYTRLITRIPVKDTTGGYKCFRRQVLETINLDDIQSGGYAFQVEMNWKTWMAGFRIKEIPIIFADRTIGQSKMSKAIVREAVLIVWKLGLAGLFRRPRKHRSNDEPAPD
ncbi:MAG: polyprenol monophosphomannose synthase [Candidatus Hatepunaea meridiana]|nr:polyprenol monophosphomannose synthase [Candidatus Hatepunaea meridiana]